MIKKILLNFNSEYYFKDLLGVFISIFFRPKSVWTSSLIIWKNKGLVKADSLLIGINSNRLGLIPFSKGIISIEKNGILQTGKGVRIALGCRIFIQGQLEIGRGTYINPHCLILAREQIAIGESCAISWNVQILDSDLHEISYESRRNSGQSAPIKIGDKVWIGADVLITKGVTIGNGAVIAAGSVVVGNIRENCLYGGNPAKLIKEHVSWS